MHVGVITVRIEFVEQLLNNRFECGGIHSSGNKRLETLGRNICILLGGFLFFLRFLGRRGLLIHGHPSPSGDPRDLLISIVVHVDIIEKTFHVFAHISTYNIFILI